MMIIANKGSVKTEGTNLDIIYEFNSIINILKESNPEILLGVLTAWSDVIMDLDNVNRTKLGIVAHMSDDFIKLQNESEGDNV